MTRYSSLIVAEIAVTNECSVENPDLNVPVGDDYGRRAPRNSGRLLLKCTQKSGSCRSANSKLGSRFRRKSLADQGISGYPSPNCTRNRLNSTLATKPIFTYLPLLRIRMPVIISKAASSNAKNVILGMTTKLHRLREAAKRAVVPNVA